MQLKTTHLFYTPADNVAFVTSAELAKTMQRVAAFSFAKGLLGDGAQSADFIGMTFPGNVTQGDANNVKLRFDDSFENGRRRQAVITDGVRHATD